MKEETVSKIRKMLVHDLFVELPEDQLGLDAGLQSAFGLDSLGFVELRLLCAQAFNITISDEDFSPDNFSSIRRLGTFIERRQTTAIITPSK